MTSLFDEVVAIGHGMDDSKRVDIEDVPRRAFGAFSVDGPCRGNVAPLVPIHFGLRLVLTRPFRWRAVSVIFGPSVECLVLPVELLSDYLDLIDEPVLVISGKRSFLVGIRELTGVLAEHVGLPIATASRTQSTEEDQALLNFLDSAVASALVQLAARLVVLAVAVLGL